MTAIASYIQHFVGVSAHEEQTRTRVLHMLRQAGLLRTLLMVWIGGAILVYLVAVYSVFGLSVTLSQNGAVAKALTESNTIMELNLQREQTEFARNNQDVLESMQKISEIRYVGPTDTAVSRARTFDQNQ
ncbi:MAG: hypothetical protein Q8R30_01315 [bacterium]|nr:hypothetical protein [bacterium]MDZ4285663.1 hypothetical protein [Candidatus Sungbacteria bacterium]